MSKLNTNTLENVAGTESVLVEKLAQLEARMALIDDKQFSTAWVNFDGTDGSIRDSFNVTSVVRDLLGMYTISFTTDMDRLDYLITGNHSGLGGGASTLTDRNTHQLGTCIVETYNSSGTVDASNVSVVIFGGKN